MIIMLDLNFVLYEQLGEGDFDFMSLLLPIANCRQMPLLEPGLKQP